MTGIVLCGGESKRMGADKGLMLKENERWVKIAFNKLHALNMPVFISVNAEQAGLYGVEFPGEQLVIDDAAMPVKGPLHGLLSLHKLQPEEDLLALPCDLLSMDIPILKHLVETYHLHPGSECYVFHNENGIQPFAGIYTAALLEKASLQLASGELDKFSMKHLLLTGKSYMIPIEDEWELSFTNFNYKNDIDYE